MNHAQLNIVSGASGAYDPTYAGAGARQSQHGDSHAGSSNGSHDIYAGKNSCFISIGLGALGVLKMDRQALWLVCCQTDRVPV